MLYLLVCSMISALSSPFADEIHRALRCEWWFRRLSIYGSEAHPMWPCHNARLISISIRTRSREHLSTTSRFREKKTRLFYHWLAAQLISSTSLSIFAVNKWSRVDLLSGSHILYIISLSVALNSHMMTMPVTLLVNHLKVLSLIIPSHGGTLYSVEDEPNIYTTHIYSWGTTGRSECVREPFDQETNHTECVERRERK